MVSIWPKYLIQLDNGSIRSATGYEAAVEIWIDTYGMPKNIKFEKKNEDGSWKMPDYSILK